MTIPLRSIMLADLAYPSPYVNGVQQGMALLGHWHRTFDIRNSVDVLDKAIQDVQPHLIWLHMAFWHRQAPKPLDMQALLAKWKSRGAYVAMHDGDAKIECRVPEDLSSCVSVALCNHRCDRSPWKVPVLHWAYFCWNQAARAAPAADFGPADLCFAGTVSRSDTYNERTWLVQALELEQRFKFSTLNLGYNTLFRTAEVAASFSAVLGFGRPEVPGWLDVRVFQYPGAGAVLLHDDVGGLLEPYEHYVPYHRKAGDIRATVESIACAMEEVRRHGDAIRQQAFFYVQRHHSSTARCQQVLSFLGLVK